MRSLLFIGDRNFISPSQLICLLYKIKIELSVGIKRGIEFMFVAHSADISCSICLPLFKKYVLQITVVKVLLDCLNGAFFTTAASVAYLK